MENTERQSKRGKELSIGAGAKDRYNYYEHRHDFIGGKARMPCHPSCHPNFGNGYINTKYEIKVGYNCL